MSNYLTGLAQLNPQVKRHNGGGTSLTLDENGTTNATMLYVNGVGQTPGIDFNVSGATLTTTSTLPAGTNIATTIQYFNTGVVNTVADDAIGLGQMASGTDGNLITYDASGNPAHVATGNDGQVLTSAGAGAAPAFEALPTGGGWEFVSSVTASTSSTVAFTTMATGYDYQVTWSTVLLSVDGMNPGLQAQLGTTGPSYVTSGYSGTGVSITSSGASGSQGNITTYITTQGSTDFGNQADEAGSGEMTILDPGANAPSSAFGLHMYGKSDSTPNMVSFGTYCPSNVYTAIKFYPNSGTITSGTFKLYKRPNA